MSVPSGLTRKMAKRLRGPTCSQRENMMSPLGRTTGLRSWLWLAEICVIGAAVAVDRVQVEHALALVLVDGEIGLAECLGLGRGLAVRGEHESAVGRQVGRIDVVVGRRTGDAAEACRSTGRRSCRIPRCSSDRYRPPRRRRSTCCWSGSASRTRSSCRRTRPLGSDTSPLPCVIAAVTLNSGALGEDFSRIIKSPAGGERSAVGGVHVQRRRALGVGDRRVAGDGERALRVRARAGATRNADDGRERERSLPTSQPGRPS